MEKNTAKRVHLTHHELLELIAVVRCIKHVAAQQHNKAEVKLMNELLTKLLDYDVDEAGTAIVIDRMTRFSLWLCMEKYIAFCSETKQYNEYALAVTISSKLSY